MSEYPKALELYGKKSLLDFSTSTWYRIDSTEDEKHIREQHAKAVLNTKRELKALFPPTLHAHLRT